MGKRSLSSPILSQPTPEMTARVHANLLQWYRVHQRDLPWRSTSDAYAILVSEIMLQQTQVERVLPKYHQFLTAFPTLVDLAAAPTAEVITVWAPLGYNSRAVRLQSIARQVIAEFGGQIPASVDELLRLKGIGRYTAGAIACFAYHQQVATVDTNIYRVLHRIFLGLEHPEPRISTEHMFTFAEQVLPPGEAYNWNQALMDLGATVCGSTNPQCALCPLQEQCQAYRDMSQYSLFPGGTVLRQLRKVAEPKTPYETKPFTSTSRYFRGRIIDHLRSLVADERITLAKLGPIIKADYSEADAAWLLKLVEGLAKDGLLNFQEDGIRLP
ncbi:MAG TPA: A/G-specific adenine glycosylase [Ktedonobacteraceae bacterium]|nr:A/G-specific adenine glycosylase [Ktedonobacteraceae bacterium]